MGAIRLGMITPSSNTVLEPACAAMLRDLPGVSAHFARLRVTRICLDAGASAQFDVAPMVAAAALLADAKVPAICAAITAASGLPATSASLGTVALFRRTGLRRFGLVTPYTADVQARIVAQYARLGFTCTAERHVGVSDNFAFAGVTADVLAGMVREVAASRPDAISILCTNLDGAALAPALELETGVAVYDSTACAVWASLQMAGCDAAPLQGWGSLFLRTG